jgi:hypothetical protein
MRIGQSKPQSNKSTPLTVSLPNSPLKTKSKDDNDLASNSKPSEKLVTPKIKAPAAPVVSSGDVDLFASIGISAAPTFKSPIISSMQNTPSKSNNSTVSSKDSGKGWDDDDLDLDD